MKLKFALHFSISMKIASTIKKFNFSDIRIVHLLSSVCGKNIFPFFLVNLVLTLDVWQYCGNKKFSFAHRANCPQTFLPFEVLHQDLFRTFEGHLPSRFNSNLGMPAIEILRGKNIFWAKLHICPSKIFPNEFFQNASMLPTKYINFMEFL